MRPPETFLGQSIRSLQTMLRVIAQEDENQPSLIPDGIYGAQTMAAVAAFQRNHGLPATGVTNQDTWEAVRNVYEPAMIRIGPAEPLQLILDPGEVLERGSQSPDLFIIQGMLTVLSRTYGSVTPPELSGELDEATALSVASFQELSGLPQTGELDKITWKHLALHYPLATNLNRDDRLRKKL